MMAASLSRMSTLAIPYSHSNNSNTQTQCYATDTSYDFNLCDDAYNPLPWNFMQKEFKMPVMGSLKNLSPTRLARRRKKAAASRKARKRNRK
jgi:hypothetical protein